MKLSSLFLAVILITGTCAPAQDPPSKQTILAEQLLVELNVDKTMESALAQVAQMQVQMMDSKSLSPAAKDKQAKIMKIITDESRGIFSWDALKPAFIQIYAQTFTEEELQGMIDFFKTPVGRTWIDKQPQIQAASMQKIQAIMLDAGPRIQDAVRQATAGETPGSGGALSNGTVNPPFVH